MRRVPIVAILAAGALAPAAGAATPGQIVARLNAQRRASGIPAGLTLNAAWTNGCRLHVRYEELNGIPWTHTETPGKRGYTKAGADAGVEGVQAYEYDWLQGNPFENLPLHLAALLNPALLQIGAYESGPRTCVSVVLGYDRRFATDGIFTYPGPGVTGVAPSQVVRNEWPHSPGDVVGLLQGRATGPTIYLFAVGPWFLQRLRIMRASLRGPRGRVAVRAVDPRSHPAIDPYVGAGIFFLVPVSPLASGTRYTASVTVSGGGDSQTKTWSFRTR